MTKYYPHIKALLVVTFILVVASATQAQSRTWVSGVGDDLNPCSRTAPCRTFAGAINKTAKDGEISVLDPGAYGAVTITKSIYINGTHGAGYGSITNPLVNGIIINITDVNDVRKAVRLRSLDINGVSTGINGVSILAANNVWVEDCVIDGNTGNGTTSGIGIRVATTAATTCNLYVSDTKIHKNVTGIRVTSTAGFAVANIRDSNIEGNTTGVDVAANGFATIEKTRFAANTTNGVATTAASATITIRDSLLSNNGTAINAAAGSTVRALSNLLNNNTTGFGGTTAVIQTDGQNRSIANGGGGPGGGLVTIQ
jgi:Right handed beta helix region